MQRIEALDSDYDRLINKGRETYIIDRINEIVEETSSITTITTTTNPTTITPPTPPQQQLLLLAAIIRALRKTWNDSINIKSD